MGVIPELQSTIQEATDYLHEFAKAAMKQAALNRTPEAGVTFMANTCVYMFVKGIEAVFLWSDSPDGNISIEFVPEEIFELDINTDLDDGRREILMRSMDMGETLFQAHNDFMYQELTTLPGRNEEWVHEEMKKAILWSMQLGVGHSLCRGYQNVKG